MKKGILFLIGLMYVCVAQAAPLSDLAEEEFNKGPQALVSSLRSPFVPSYRFGEDVDIATLLVQGIVSGKKLKMALLSGRVVREGEKVGRYTVDKITPEEVQLSLESSLYHLKTENYILPTKEKPDSGFVVEFRNASLKDALRLLAKASGLNLIMPEDLGGRVTLSFTNADLMESLQSMLRVNGYEYAIESDILRVGKPDAFAGGTDLKTENFRLRYATAKDLVDKIKTLLSDRGAVIADERTNVLTVKDRAPLVANIASLIQQIDRMDQQVQIAARVVDATRNFSRALGIRWGVTDSTGNIQTTGTSSVGVNADTNHPLNVNLGAANPTSGLGLIVGNLTRGLGLEAQLTAAEEKGDVQILSKPSVTTLNNMPAKIRSGTKIYVKSTSSISLGTAPGVGASGGTSGLQEINTGIELTVTPQISIDDYIKMKIEAVESEADFSRTVDGIPAVIDNTATTTVILRDGETTVIGGLYRQKLSKTRRGVPGFQKVPLVGLLFQSRSRLQTDSELMIFITPKIVKF